MFRKSISLNSNIRNTNLLQSNIKTFRSLSTRFVMTKCLNESMSLTKKQNFGSITNAGLILNKFQINSNKDTKKFSSDNNMGDRLVWIDCEMTGLNIDTDHLIEVACIVTDGNLNILAEGPNIVIHQSDEIMDGMNDWCKEHHGKSGLTDQVRNSKISLGDAESTLVDFVKRHTVDQKCPLAGNSVHADKRFLDKYMPTLMEHLHYRIVDVSTIKELCRRWYPKEYSEAPKKKLTHRALDDIKESIAELQYYRSHLFKMIPY